MERVKVLLEDEEFVALSRLADQDMRPIPSEIRAIIRERLQMAGLLEKAPKDVQQWSK